MKNLKLKKKQTKKKTEYVVEVNELKFNKAIEINYQHQLLVLKREMVKEYTSRINKFYEENLTYLVGDADDDVVARLQLIIDMIGSKWYERFFKISHPLSRKVVLDINNHNDKRFDAIKKKHLFLLKNTQDREQLTKIMQSSIAENVGLIKSIPKKYHDDILGDVMRTVGVGGDLQALNQALSKHSHLTSKRISLIARDQTAKATALLDRQKAIDTGFRTAIWQKSIAGKTHRKDHAEADGNEFDIEKGCLISGEYILPRMKINCKCSYKLVIKFDDNDDGD